MRFTAGFNRSRRYGCNSIGRALCGWYSSRLVAGQLVVPEGPVHRVRGPRGADGHHAGPQVRGGNAALPVAGDRRTPVAAAPQQVRPGHEAQVRGHAGHGVLEVERAKRAGPPDAATRVRIAGTDDARRRYGRRRRRRRTRRRFPSRPRSR